MQSKSEMISFSSEVHCHSMVVSVAIQAEGKSVKSVAMRCKGCPVQKQALTEHLPQNKEGIITFLLLFSLFSPPAFAAAAG